MISQTADRADPRRASSGRLGAVIARCLILAAALPFAALLLLVLAVAALPLFGYQADVITGGSMQPAIHLGSLTVSQPVATDDLQIGDIITFRREGASVDVTHRIVAIDQVDGKRAFTTKGDANDSPDPTAITFSRQVNKVVFTAPYAGYAIAFVHSPRGMAVLILLPLIGLAILRVLKAGGRREPAEAVPGG